MIVRKRWQILHLCLVIFIKVKKFCGSALKFLLLFGFYIIVFVFVSGRVGKRYNVFASMLLIKILLVR